MPDCRRHQFARGTAALIAAVAGSAGAATLARTYASDQRSPPAVGQRDRYRVVSGAGLGYAPAPTDIPSYLVRPGGLLRNGLTPNPFTYG